MKSIFPRFMNGKTAAVVGSSAALALATASSNAQAVGIVDDLFTAADPATLVTKIGTFLVAIIAIPIALFVYRKVKTLFAVA